MHFHFKSTKSAFSAGLTGFTDVFVPRSGNEVYLDFTNTPALNLRWLSMPLIEKYKVSLKILFGKMFGTNIFESFLMILQSIIASFFMSTPISVRICNVNIVLFAKYFFAFESKAFKNPQWHKYALTLNFNKGQSANQAKSLISAVNSFFYVDTHQRGDVSHDIWDWLHLFPPDWTSLPFSFFSVIICADTHLWFIFLLTNRVDMHRLSTCVTHVQLGGFFFLCTTTQKIWTNKYEQQKCSVQESMQRLMWKCGITEAPCKLQITLLSCFEKFETKTRGCS